MPEVGDRRTLYATLANRLQDDMVEVYAPQAEPWDVDWWHLGHGSLGRLGSTPGWYRVYGGGLNYPISIGGHIYGVW